MCDKKTSIVNEKFLRVLKQVRESWEDEPIITCRCNRRKHIRYLCKCFHCGEYFCQQCAKQHFGLKEEKKTPKCLNQE